MADNLKNQYAIKAKIKRESKRARDRMHRIDAEALVKLEGLYHDAALLLMDKINNFAASDGAVPLYVLHQLLAQANGILNELSLQQAALIQSTMASAAIAGSAPFVAELDAAVISRINESAVQFVNEFIAQDGLQLSSRLWRIDNHAATAVAETIKHAVVMGQSASQTADNLLASGQGVPAAVRSQMKSAQASILARDSRDVLLTGDGQQSARYNAMRVMRTEINRAHGEAYQAAAFKHPDVIGTRFILSPNHPKVDVCDMHARVNRYGLGSGVYPEGKNPWPAHPNTLSFTEVVFADEVTDSDRKGKQTRVDFIKKQSKDRREGILGGKGKRVAFDAGHIAEGSIATPWRIVEKRLVRNGVDINALFNKYSQRKLKPDFVAKPPKEKPSNNSSR